MVNHVTRQFSEAGDIRGLFFRKKKGFKCRLRDCVYQISDIQSYIRTDGQTYELTRIKATSTRYETLWKVTTNNSKNTHICLNVVWMVHEKDLFWYITTYITNEILKWALQTAPLSQKWAAIIFSISNSFILIVHENDQFWYIATNMA